MQKGIDGLMSGEFRILNQGAIYLKNKKLIIIIKEVKIKNKN